MIIWSDIATFALVSSLLVMSPGPNGVLIAQTVPSSGRRAGFANVAGIVSAFYLHGTLSILGISLILVQSAFAFSVIKYLGAAYLCWVGLKALWAAYKHVKPQSIHRAGAARSLPRAYLDGLLTNALNPKVSMFYLAAFPQFITVGETSIVASFSLVLVHSVLAAFWFGGMVVLFAQLTLYARGMSFQRWLKGVTGVVFIGFGLKLASLKPNL
jgi:threonine/homoserine/homoserine lactone efflux protein